MRLNSWISRRLLPLIQTIRTSNCDKEPGYRHAQRRCSLPRRCYSRTAYLASISPVVECMASAPRGMVKGYTASWWQTRLFWRACHNLLWYCVEWFCGQQERFPSQWFIARVAALKGGSIPVWSQTQCWIGCDTIRAFYPTFRQSPSWRWCERIPGLQHKSAWCRLIWVGCRWCNLGVNHESPLPTWQRPLISGHKELNSKLSRN